MKRCIYWLICALSSIITMNMPIIIIQNCKRKAPDEVWFAIRENPSTVVVSWRYLSSDPMETAFNIYRDGKKLTSQPIMTGTLFRDENSSQKAVVYEVRP